MADVTVTTIDAFEVYVVLAGDGTLHADGTPGKAYEPRR